MVETRHCLEEWLRVQYYALGPFVTSWVGVLALGLLVVCGGVGVMLWRKRVH